MTLPNEKFREVQFVLLFSIELSDESDDEIVRLVSKELKVSSTHVRTALEKVRKILDHSEELEEKISALSKEYRFSRIQMVERAILRLSCYEILYDDTIPAKVAISEGMRLARKFATISSVSFINAILDALWKSADGLPVEQETIEKSIEEMIEVEELTTKYIEENAQDTE